MFTEATTRLLSETHIQVQVCWKQEIKIIAKMLVMVVMGKHGNSDQGQGEDYEEEGADDNDRRKFRSQTSDNMDRRKAEMGRVREEKRRDEKKKEDQKRRSQNKKKDPCARKGRKVAKH